CLKATEHRVVDGLDFLPQLGQGTPSYGAEHAGVGPFAPCASRAELSFEQPALATQSRQQRFRSARREAIPPGEIGRGERRMGARVTPRQLPERIVHWC